jgi:hypothetical protein
MSSFGKLFENMHAFKESSKQIEDSLAVDAIRQGFLTNPEFWQNFISLLNNPEALAKLFNVPQHKVTSWYSRIEKYLQKYMEEEKDNIGNKLSKKRRLVKTSDYEDFV